MAVGDVFRASIVMSLANEPIINTIHFQETASGGGAPETSLINILNASFIPPLAACIPVTQTFSQIIIQGVKPVSPVVVGTSTTANGTVGGAWVPTQAAVIISRKTPTPGKGGRGRLFIGAIPQSLLSVSDQDHVSLGVYQTFAAALLSTYANGGFSWQVVLFKRKANTALLITSAPVNSVIKTRRSRSFGTRFHRRRRHTVGSI